MGRTNARYDLCLFDLDGTLTDSGPGITKSAQYALAALGIHEEPDSLREFVGPPLRASFQNRYGFLAEETELAISKYREYYEETGMFENTVYPGIPQTLRALQAGGKVLAVATNKATVYARRILEHLELAGYFSFVSGDEMDGSLSRDGKRKIVRAALAACPGRAAVMIGDRSHDMAGARANGIDGIGVLYGYGTRDELVTAGAVALAESARTLEQMLLEE